MYHRCGMKYLRGYTFVAGMNDLILFDFKILNIGAYQVCFMGIKSRNIKICLIKFYLFIKIVFSSKN